MTEHLAPVSVARFKGSCATCGKPFKPWVTRMRRTFSGNVCEQCIRLEEIGVDPLNPDEAICFLVTRDRGRTLNVELVYGDAEKSVNRQRLLAEDWGQEFHALWARSFAELIETYGEYVEPVREAVGS